MPICGDGVRTRAVRTPGGVRVDVLDPDPTVPEEGARLLASFHCPLGELLLVPSGRPSRAEQGGKTLGISIDGSVVEVRYGAGNGAEDVCETLRRDYFDALMRLAGA